MKYIVLGLGNYGSALAEELTSLGHEVVAADTNPRKVDIMKDKIAATFILDVSDEQAINILPINDVDGVFVAIGENFGDSVKAVALLRQSNVEKIYARAIDHVHRAVLEALGVYKVLTPESFSAKRLARELEFGGVESSFRIDKEHYVMMFTLPARFEGVSIKEMRLSEDYGLLVLGVKHKIAGTNFIGVDVSSRRIVEDFSNDYIFKKDDIMVAYGLYRNFRELFRSL